MFDDLIPEWWRREAVWDREGQRVLEANDGQGCADSSCRKTGRERAMPTRWPPDSLHVPKPRNHEKVTDETEQEGLDSTEQKADPEEQEKAHQVAGK